MKPEKWKPETMKPEEMKPEEHKYIKELLRKIKNEDIPTVTRGSLRPQYI